MNSTELIRVYSRSLNGACIVQLFKLAPCRLRGKTSLRNFDFLGFITYDPGSRSTISQCFDARIVDIFDGEIYRFHNSIRAVGMSEFDKLCVFSQKHFCELCRDIINYKPTSSETPSQQTLFEFSQYA